MSKKLTQYEIDCLVRQLTNMIVIPLEEENNTIIDAIPENESILADTVKITALQSEIESLREKAALIELERNNLLSLYNGNNYIGNSNPIKWMLTKQRVYKESLAVLKKVPSVLDIRDLVILNSNLDLQEIIKVVTEKFALNEN